MDCFNNKLTIPALKKVIATWDITLDNILSAIEQGSTVKTSRQWSKQGLSNTIIRFIYYTEIYEKYPFGLLAIEVARIILLLHPNSFSVNEVESEELSISCTVSATANFIESLI